MKRITQAWSALAIVASLIFTTSGLALARQAELSRASGPSPYSSCTLGSFPGSVVTPNAEVEPFVAANPLTPLAQSANLVSVWQQDAWSDGGARGGVAGFSFDAGATWREVPLPFSGCAPGAVVDPATAAPYDRVADNWVSFGPDGTAYTTATAVSTTTLDNAVVAATSSDGGRTWQNATVVKTDAGTTSGPTHFFNDKDAVTADPHRPGTAYLVWDRLEAPNGFPLFTRAFAYRGPTWFAVTTDGGHTWSAPKVIVDPGQNSQTLGNQLVVAPDGSLYVFFNILQHFPSNSAVSSVAFAKSTDGGLTWSTAQTIAANQSVGVTDPNTGAPVTTGSISDVPAAVDPMSGTLYVAWQDARFSGGQYDEVALASSTDGGAHWSTPTRVNTPIGRPAFDPALQVAADGTLGVTYYDFRNLAPGNTTTLPTNYWLKKSPPGGVAFGADIPVVPADQPFNLMAAPSVRGGLFLGDYQGLATIGSQFLSVSVQTTCTGSSCVGGPNPTDVFAGTF